VILPHKGCARLRSTAGWRSPRQLRFFDGLELVEPGLVHIQQWRPAIDVSETVSVWARVARK
jgi:S-adenosyl methyltransferase